MALLSETIGDWSPARLQKFIINNVLSDPSVLPNLPRLDASISGSAGDFNVAGRLLVEGGTPGGGLMKLDVNNTDNTTGVRAGITLRTGSGHHVRLQTVQGVDWLQLTNATDAVQWAWRGQQMWNGAVGVNPHSTEPLSLGGSSSGISMGDRDGSSPRQVFYPTGGHTVLYREDTGNYLAFVPKAANKGIIDFAFGLAGRESNAGKMGYEVFTSGALDIVGAGTSSPNRVIKLWDHIIVPENANIQFYLRLGKNAPSPPATDANWGWLYVNSAGSLVYHGPSGSTTAIAPA
jgi:hypothetical protein